MDGYVKRIKEAFSSFGDVNFFPFELNDGRVDYATICLVARERVTSNLIDEVNSRLSLDNGYLAFLRLIQMHDLEDGRLNYSIEVVPFESVRRDDLEVVTEKFLKSLPGEVEGFRQRNPGRGKRRR